MHISALLRLWCGIREPVSRWLYAVSGVSLVLVKYLVEAGVIRGLGGRWMTPLEFISPLLSTRSDLFEGLPDWLGWAVFAWNLPFVWIAVSMSVRRAAAAGVSPWLGLTVVAPGLNLAIMGLLSILPDATPQAWRAEAATEPELSAVGPAASVTGPDPSAADDVTRVLKAIGAACGVGAGMFLFTVYAINTYAAAFFLGTPLVMGAVAGFLYNRPTPRSLGRTIGLGTTVMLVAGGFLLLFAFEGLICLVMAVPLAMPLAILGAIRHCEFTTGDFVEPITSWDEPARLAFDVREQPDPMVELSPWREVRPPHLHDHSLQSRRGEFRLVDLGEGRTRLEGRTWYTFDMHPQGYWTLWSDLSIHKIHRRVLEHIRQLAEAERPAVVTR